MLKNLSPTQSLWSATSVLLSEPPRTRFSPVLRFSYIWCFEAIENFLRKMEMSTGLTYYKFTLFANSLALITTGSTAAHLLYNCITTVDYSTLLNFRFIFWVFCFHWSQVLLRLAKKNLFLTLSLLAIILFLHYKMFQMILLFAVSIFLRGKCGTVERIWNQELKPWAKFIYPFW